MEDDGTIKEHMGMSMGSHQVGHFLCSEKKGSAHSVRRLDGSNRTALRQAGHNVDDLWT